MATAQPTVTEASTRGNTPEYSVSELSGALKRTVESTYGQVRVRGEITGWKRAASGHVYLCLKDAGAVLDAVMWKGTASALAFRAEDGLEVIATGKLTTYPGRSKYQLIIERLEPAGAGTLLAQLEALRARLAAEGLFDAAGKKPLPDIPGVIGIVTSPTGAVIRDMLHRLAERFPRRVILWPVVVQGEGAASQLAAAIAGFNALGAGGAIPRPDLLIVARGGGSIEDLAAFNDEAVVRAVAASAIPTITAVGHETDTTLVDFASDHRAPTPTAAAERAVPVRAELDLALRQGALRLARATARANARRADAVRGFGARLPTPRALLALRQQRYDEFAERLPRALRGNLAGWRGRANAAGAALRPPLLVNRRDRARDQLAGLSARLAAASRAAIAHERQALTRAAAPLRPALLAGQATRAATRLAAAARVLESLSPLGILARGYAVVEDAHGHVVGSAARAKTLPLLTLRFHDAKLSVSTSLAAQGKLF